LPAVPPTQIGIDALAKTRTDVDCRADTFAVTERTIGRHSLSSPARSARCAIASVRDRHISLVGLAVSST